MSDLHIDDFYKDAARILVFLYSQFPRRVMLYVDDISGPDEPDEFGLHSPRHQACFQTMLWLATSDYLRFDQTVGQDALDQVCLTHRAFLLLNSALPESDQAEEEPAPHETLAIDRLRRELESGTSYSLADLMKQLMRASRRFS